ncbi:hypothetical protein FisN_27Lh124 [Fistulifera solaris]|uniref:PH domain-containing protein n=1 Tax=Fistulifera solaris TaxID=1519565 RepID=A0A1Z5KAX9_FISSO|nr:hypothetical protein FisN_27Lh124 [Fistulifera solaris]|eukprot:GAX23346.1 hypothetical protein FisN_27Lh124 [Fistulifera solaris]
MSGMNQHFQGELWKRRDVFKQNWRPRWFVIQPEEKLLTYYLLTSQSRPANATPTSLQRSPSSNISPRSRTISVDSLASEQSLDYDILPRGSLSLENCTVSKNGIPAKNDLFMFTVVSSNNEKFYLATRSDAARSDWMQRIIAARRGQTLPLPRSSPRTPPQEVCTPSRLDRATPRSGSGRITNWNDVLQEGPYSLNVPEALTNRLRQTMEKYLSVAAQDKTSNWTILHPKKRLEGGHSYKTLSRTHPDGHGMIYTVAEFRNITPAQLFSTSIDPSRRKRMEPTLSDAKRLHVYNPHTFLDVYQFRGVWPVASREFAVVVHWQVVQWKSAPAIVAYSFSCPEAEEAAPESTSKAVRAKLIINFGIIEAIGVGSRWTRIASFDLMGGISQSLSNVVLMQQSAMPELLLKYFEQTKVPSATTVLSNESIRDMIIGPILGIADIGTRRHLDFVPPVPESPDVTSLSDLSEKSASKEVFSPPSAFQAEALILFLPLLIYLSLSFVHRDNLAFWCFCLGVFFAIRQTVCLQLVQGPVLSRGLGLEPPLTSTVTCRISVPAKGIRRYLTNSKEDNEERRLFHQDITHVHLVISAIAKALTKEKQLCVRHHYIPWLMIDTAVDISSEPITVSVSENGGSVINLENVQERSVQSIADELSEAENDRDRGYFSTHYSRLGQCLVVASHDTSLVTVDAVVSARPEVTIVAVVEKDGRSLSLTMVVPITADVSACRRYAADVQRHLQFPELCDN